MRLLRKLRYPAKRKGRNRTTVSDTPLWIEVLICLILSPVLIPLVIYAVLKWMFTLRYPVSTEGAKLRITEKYLNDCLKYQSHEAIEKDKVCQD